MSDEKKLLAQAMLEWTLQSKNEWLEFSEKDIKELTVLAEKRGIVVSSPDIAILKTYYAQIGVANNNNVLLNKAPAEKGLKTLIGKQVNFDHLGAKHVCGYILDAKIEKDMIVTYACIFKSLFSDQFDEVKRKFASGELFVSFEIWNVDPETKKSVMTMQEDGIKVIDPIIFHGMGLLLSKPPACPKARVMALLASQDVITEAEKIIEPILQPNDELVYAELALPCRMCEECKNKQKGESIKMAEQVEEAKVIEEPIDPNLFLKEDGSLDEEKLTAALPKAVTDRVKELVKEGKEFKDAIKQAWKEHKDKSKASDEVDTATSTIICSKCGYSEAYERPLEVCPKCQEPMAKTPEQTATPVKAEEAPAEVAPVAEVAQTQREGNQNWTCPDCAFTFPLLADGEKQIQQPLFCPACGMPYYADADESPCACEMNPEAQPMDEELVNQDEMANIEESKKLSYENRKNLPNSDFAVVVKHGDKVVRMYPIQDEAHVRNALARLGQAKPRETLKRLGVSLDSVKRKVLNRAKKLGMTQLVDNYKATSSIEDEAILNLSNTIADLQTQLTNKETEMATVKAELDKVTKDKEAEVITVKQELERKSQEIATLTATLEATPNLSVGSVDAGTQDEWKQKRAKIDELAYGKKKSVK